MKREIRDRVELERKGERKGLKKGGGDDSTE